MRSFRTVAALVFLLVVGSSAPAAAQDDVSELDAEVSDVAEQEYNRARALYEEGKYAEAADAFRSTYSLTPATILLYNIAMSEWRAGDLEAARAATIRAQQEDLPPELATKVAALLVSLHTLEVSHAMVGLERTSGAEVGEPTVGTERVAPPAARADKGWTTTQWIGLTTASAGVVSIGGALISSVAVSDESDALDKPGGETDDVIVDRIETYQAVGIGLLSFGALAAAVGVVLFVIGSDDGDESPALSVSPMVGEATGVSLEATF